MRAMQTVAETPSALEAYRRLKTRRFALVTIMAVLLVLALITDILTGPAALEISEVINALIGSDAAPRTHAIILWSVRLPQALTALLIGAALALAGAEMQTILDNPLASPFTLGVSSAAAFGAALAVMLGVGLPGVPAEWLVPANAFVFAIAAVLLLELLSLRSGLRTSDLVLFGIALVFSFNAAVALMQFIATETALQQFVFWSMGSTANTSWFRLGFVALSLVLVFPFSFRASWRLTALRLGSDKAQSLGIDVGRLRLFSLLRISLLAAVSVAAVGTIGFVGLVGPHIARLLVGEDHRVFLPASALVGALVMSAASICAKTLVPGVLLPIGVVTSIVGVPVFLWLILRQGRQK